MLEATGFAAEALRCYSRGEDWAAVSRLVGEQNPPIASTGGWLDALPTTLVESDPWLVLARARGRRLPACSRRRSPTTRRPSGSPVRPPSARRAGRSASPSPPGSTRWRRRRAAGSAGCARRRGATRSRCSISIDADDPGSLLAAGLAALIAGQLPRARQLLEDALCHRVTDANL